MSLGMLDTSTVILLGRITDPATLPLYTCNPEDFDGIPALDVRPVPHPDR